MYHLFVIKSITKLDNALNKLMKSYSTGYCIMKSLKYEEKILWTLEMHCLLQT